MKGDILAAFDINKHGRKARNNFSADKANETGHAPRFENGKKVWVTFSDDKPVQYTIKKSHFQPMTRIYMYSFEETTICCGEMYLRYKKTDKKLRMGECIHDGAAAEIGYVEEGINNERGIMSEGVRTWSGNIGTIFFRPDKTFINWLVEYAAGRVIVEIGCGTADVLTQLADAGGKVFGIEPYWSMEDNAAMNFARLEAGKNIINISPTYVKDNERLLKEMGSKALMLICRPCHNGFVEDAIDLKHPDTEVLYITVPENWDKYDDLGKYKDDAVLVKHKGWSADDEKVWSVK